MARRIQFGLLVFGRVFLNAFDIAGVLGVGWLVIEATGGQNNLPPIFSSWILSEPEGPQRLLWLAIFVAILFVSKSFFAAFMLSRTQLFLAKNESRMASEIVEGVFSSTIARVSRLSKGDLMWAANSSPQQAVSGILTATSTLVAEGSLFLLVFALFFVASPTAALLLVAYLLAIVMLFQLVIGKRLTALGRSLARYYAGVLDSLEDLNTAFRELRVYGAEAPYRKRFDNFREQLALAQARQFFYQSLPRYVIESALVIGIVSLITYQWLNGNLVEGAATTAVFLTGGLKLMAATLPLQNALSGLKSCVPQAGVAHDLLREYRYETGRKEPQPARLSAPAVPAAPDRGLAVEVENVDFAYDGVREPVLRNVTFTIQRGTFTAIVGPSGSGKTALADLLTGLNRPGAGTIKVGGYPPAELIDRFPGRIAYVPQIPAVVSGTVGENVAIGHRADEIDRKKLIWCLEKACLLDFVENLPHGLDSKLGRRNDQISGGQRQRLGLARALYGSPSLILLDEATSGLDAGVEAEITETLKQLVPNITVMVIAHRLSTIQDAQKILVLNEGKIVAEGTFSEVRKLAPFVNSYVENLKIRE